MGIRAVLSKPFASSVVSYQRKWSEDPVKYQNRIFKQLLRQGVKTLFGKEHKLSAVNNYEEYKQSVPIRDYEGSKEYFDRIVQGELDITWPGKPRYLSKTSGTTSGVKYIPITRDSLPNHINSARNALLNYVHQTGNAKFLDGRLIFLSGSPELDMTKPVPTGRLSGIVNHHVPGYLRSNQLPTYETNCIEAWEEKLEKIIDETIDQPMSLISGIPPWVQMYFDRIIERTGKTIMEVFPQFDLFVYGGVNFEPYRAKLYESIGKKIASVETYPASEGFIAYQNDQEDQALLLLVNSGIFFEFIPADEFFNDNPTRLTVGEVKTGVNYAVIINSNAGLWGYSLGDTVKFTSLFPHKLLVTGRIKHFISAFGEHVIGEEVEKAMQAALGKFPEAELTEFTVAPLVTNQNGLPRHEWYVEFTRRPSDLTEFEKELNLHLQKLNTYYDDLIQGQILAQLKVIPLKKNAFIDYMKSLGKLGGQNKVPRLSNDRKIADQLLPYADN